MAFMDALFGRAWAQRRKAVKRDEGAGEVTLSVVAGDAGWSAQLTGKDGVRWRQQSSTVVEKGAASPAEQLAEAVARLTADQPQANVTGVALYVDDPDLQLVDHRFARLHNFEPKAIKDFGCQQAGGRQVAFGSLPFGASSARELEKRVLAFLPEEKLASYFFGLGKMATALAAIVPGGAEVLHPDSHGGGIFTVLRVHGYFSTLLIANGDTGIVAMRHLPFGALALAKAYADEHGLTLEQAAAALKTRSRLPQPEAVKDAAPQPEHATGSHLALSPLLRQLRDDITATVEYFRYQRLAGRPAHMGLTFTGPAIAGLDSWLGDALQLRVEIVANAIPAADPSAADAPILNLLEGARAGLLKIGNQPFEFSRGRFVPIKGAHSDMPAKTNAASFVQLWLDKLAARIGAAPLAISREHIMAPLAVMGAIALLVLGNFYFVTGPAVQRLNDTAYVYGAAATNTVANAGRGSDQPSDAEPAIFWAGNLLAVERSLVPPMKLERLEFVPAAGRASTDFNLAITGSLPLGNDANLKLVAGFIERLSKEPSFAKRFPAVQFSGAGEIGEEANRKMEFRVAAPFAGEVGQ